jgi:MFS family permease
MGYDDVKAANYGTISYWTRPLIAVAAGFTADRFLSSKVIMGGFLITIAGSIMMASGWIDPNGSILLITSIVILSIGIYAMRGVYFALLQEGKISVAVSGTAIGIISVVGFTPDIFMGPLMGYLIDNNPGALGHQYLFSLLGGFSIIGLVASVVFYNVNNSPSH